VKVQNSNIENIWKNIFNQKISLSRVLSLGVLQPHPTDVKVTDPYIYKMNEDTIIHLSQNSW